MSEMKRLLECYVPIYACNMKCDYCYIKQNPGRCFEKKIERFPYSPKQIAYALRRERVGGSCLINLCAGGETLLSHETVELARLLLEDGHYVMIVNNGTVTKHILELCEFPDDLKKRLWVRFSFHFLELKNSNRINMFFDNVNRVRRAGASIAVEMVASDDYIPYIGDIKALCLNRIGSLPEINIARKESDFSILTELPMEKYILIWSQFESISFNLKLKTVGEKRKEFCYAGDWTATINLGTGEISKCYSSPRQNIYTNPDEPLNFEAMGNRCPLPYCHNSHLWLTLGNIPELDVPTLAQIRNRVCTDGANWLTDEMLEFVDVKLKCNNSQYGLLRKTYVNLKTDFAQIKNSICSKIRSDVRKVWLILK